MQPEVKFKPQVRGTAVAWTRLVIATNFMSSSSLTHIMCIHYMYLL